MSIDIAAEVKAALLADKHLTKEGAVRIIKGALDGVCQREAEAAASQIRAAVDPEDPRRVHIQMPRLVIEGDTPRARALRERVERFYVLPGNGCGGNLHIVLDDGNLEDSSIEVCRKAAEEAADREGVEIAEELRRCSWEERCFVYGCDPDADGFEP